MSKWKMDILCPAATHRLHFYQGSVSAYTSWERFFGGGFHKHKRKLFHENMIWHGGERETAIAKFSVLIGSLKGLGQWSSFVN